MRRVVLALAGLVLAVSSAGANVPYYPDPVYLKLAEEDHHPMDELHDLAEEGDVRAQFIIADLYSKGKGGYAKNEKLAHQWFERSAIHGYYHSFIRLAALAKHTEDYISAWKWYTLAIRSLPQGNTRTYAIQARADLVEKHKLSRKDEDAGREMVSQWERFRDKERVADRKRLQERKDQRQAEAVFENRLEDALLEDEGVE